MTRMRRRQLVPVLLAVAGFGSMPAQANDFEQAWSCTLNSGHTLDDARAAASRWLQAARKMHGGDDLELSLRWPIVVPESADIFEFVIRAPSLESWGAFYDGYDPSSPAGIADEEFSRVASCSGSDLWERIAVDEADG